MVRLYRKGKECNAAPEQVALMKDAGWSTDVPEVEGADTVEGAEGADTVEGAGSEKAPKNKASKKPE